MKNLLLGSTALTMKKNIFLTIVALGISIISFCQFNQQDYGDNLTYSERLESGYYNKIPKSALFTYLGYASEGELTIIFFKASNGKKISFSNWSNSNTKKYNFMDESMQGKIFQLSWKMLNENTTLLTAKTVEAINKPVSQEFNYCVETQDEKIKLMLTFHYSVNQNGLVLYKGQQQRIAIKFVKDVAHPCNGCASPTTDSYYNETINGQINGKYVLRVTGNLIDVTYVRTKDKKMFKFFGYATGQQPCDWTM